jgi:hypothetical protein
MSLPSDLAADAVNTMQALAQLELAPAAWDVVAAQLDELEQAVRDSEPDRADAVIGRLDLFGPDRVATRIQAGVESQPTPPPAAVREHLAKLVHDLTDSL